MSHSALGPQFLLEGRPNPDPEAGAVDEDALHSWNEKVGDGVRSGTIGEEEARRAGWSA